MNQSSSQTQVPICGFEAFFGNQNKGFTWFYHVLPTNSDKYSLTPQDPKQQHKLYILVWCAHTPQNGPALSAVIRKWFLMGLQNTPPKTRASPVNARLQMVSSLCNGALKSFFEVSFLSRPFVILLDDHPRRLLGHGPTDCIYFDVATEKASNRLTGFSILGMSATVELPIGLSAIL